MGGGKADAVFQPLHGKAQVIRQGEGKIGIELAAQFHFGVLGNTGAGQKDGLGQVRDHAQIFGVDIVKGPLNF